MTNVSSKWTTQSKVLLYDMGRRENPNLIDNALRGKGKPSKRSDQHSNVRDVMNDDEGV
jgi:hypothetical protein